MMYKIKHFYYNLKRFFSNIWRLRKALWESRPYDYQGLFLLLREQLKYQVECTDKYSYHTCKDRSVKNMKICINLLDRLIEDDYNTDKWDFIKNPDSFLGRKLKPRYSLPSHNLFKLADHRRKTDMELLFKILNRKMLGWWY